VLKRFLVMWAVNVAALFVASALLENVDYSSFWWLIVAGLVFGIVNSLVRPIVRLFLKSAGRPIVLLTFGIALFLVNVLMLYITSWVVPEFEIGSFGGAVGAALIIWVVHAALETFFGFRKEKKS
jgi:putative membrane protein